MELTRKIFISGPMTGIRDYNFPKFLAVEARLKGNGYEVVNPVHICRKYKKEIVLADKSVFDEMVTEELDELKKCDTIFLMHGWEHSFGARKEAMVALENDLTIWLEN